MIIQTTSSSIVSFPASNIDALTLISKGGAVGSVVFTLGVYSSSNSHLGDVAGSNSSNLVTFDITAYSDAGSLILIVLMGTVTVFNGILLYSNDESSYVVSGSLNGAFYFADYTASQSSPGGSVAASSVTTDSTHRFATDSLISTWNGKQSPGTTLSAYGITDAVGSSDSRLSDARTPLAHTHAPADVTGTAVITTDSRLTNARTPLAHTHAPADVTGTAVITTDSRLSDARTPVAHTHAWGDITSNVPNFNNPYRIILDSSGSHIAARVAGTYGLGHGDPLAISATGTLYPLNIIYIAAADYPTINGLAAKLRVRCTIACNAVAPFTGTFICGLSPVTRPASGGGAGLVIYTIGTQVTGSTATGTNLSANTSTTLVSSDFALPADGYYVLSVVTNATMATSAHVHISMSLQIHNA